MIVPFLPSLGIAFGGYRLVVILLAVFFCAVLLVNLVAVVVLTVFRLRLFLLNRRLATLAQPTLVKAKRETNRPVFTFQLVPVNVRSNGKKVQPSHSAFVFMETGSARQAETRRVR